MKKRMRNLKNIGVALVAIFAMSAMGAAAAQADYPADFWAGAGTVQIDLEAEGIQQLSTPGKLITCEAVDGQIEYAGETDVLTGTGGTVTGCVTIILGFIKLPSTVVQEEGCHFTMTVGTFDAKSGDATGSVHICEITVNQYTNASHETLYCQQHVPAQTIEGGTVTNGERNGIETVTVDADVEVEMTSTNLGKTGCSSHNTVTARYVGTSWAYGTNEDQEVTETAITPTF